MDRSLVVVKGGCITQWSYEQYRAGPPETDGSQWRVLTRRGPLEDGVANHSSILASRTRWTVWKDKKIGHRKMSPWIGRCPVYAAGKEWRAITNMHSVVLFIIFQIKNIKALLLPALRNRVGKLPLEKPPSHWEIPRNKEFAGRRVSKRAGRDWLTFVNRVEVD